MSVNLLTRSEVIDLFHKKYGIPKGKVFYENIDLLCQLLRDVARNECPCSLFVIKRDVRNLVGHLCDQEEYSLLCENLDHSIDRLFEVGDLLYLNRDKDDGRRDVYVAPPCFVLSESGLVIIIGAVSTGDELLPEEIKSRVKHYDGLRVIDCYGDDSIVEVLKEHGLGEIKSTVWSNLPRDQKPEEIIAFYQKEIDKQPSCVGMDDVRILQRAEEVDFYANRWKEPTDENGLYIGRRPRMYGADLWGLYEIEFGTPKKVIDFPRKRMYARGCDEAWHLLMAFDRCDGVSRKCFLKREAPLVYSNFFMPIPSWAHRFMSLLGRRVDSNKALSCYEFEERKLKEVCGFLNKHFWLDLEDGEVE